jgi:hypothetical protein
MVAVAVGRQLGDIRRDTPHLAAGESLNAVRPKIGFGVFVHPFRSQ